MPFNKNPGEARVLSSHGPVETVAATAPDPGTRFLQGFALSGSVRPTFFAHEHRGTVVSSPNLPPDPQVVLVGFAAQNDLPGRSVKAKAPDDLDRPSADLAETHPTDESPPNRC